MILVKTVPAIRGGRMWERSQGGGGGIQVWYIWYIIRTFANATMYPHPAQQQKNYPEKFQAMPLEKWSSSRHFCQAGNVTYMVEQKNQRSSSSTAKTKKNTFFSKLYKYDLYQYRSNISVPGKWTQTMTVHYCQEQDVSIKMHRSGIFIQQSI
jgi:hypothetical protein